MDPTSPEFLAARRKAMAKNDAWAGHDDLDPKAPSGHAYGIQVSTRLTSYYRQTHRKSAMDIGPQDVVDCLVEANVKKWVLMGLHGYVGYLPMPRATQDVDVMVPYSQKAKATKAIAKRWPMLQQRALSQVVRFLDPADLDPDGNPKPVIDVMLPWSPFQETILKEQVFVDKATGHRLPTIEAAVVSKYAAVVSPHRAFDKKQQDAVDLRRLIKANRHDIDMQVLQELAAQVWEHGSEEISQYVEFAIEDKPFGTRD